MYRTAFLKIVVGPILSRSCVRLSPISSCFEWGKMLSLFFFFLLFFISDGILSCFLFCPFFRVLPSLFFAFFFLFFFFLLLIGSFCFDYCWLFSILLPAPRERIKTGQCSFSAWKKRGGVSKLSVLRNSFLNNHRELYLCYTRHYRMKMRETYVCYIT